MSKSKKQNNIEKKLSVDELVRLEKSHLERQNREMSIKLCEEELKRLDKEKRLLSAEYTLKLKEIQEKNNERNEIIEKNSQKNKEHKEFTDSIREKFKLNDVWGFDPLTGEIKE